VRATQFSGLKPEQFKTDVLEGAYIADASAEDRDFTRELVGIFILETVARVAIHGQFSTEEFAEMVYVVQPEGVSVDMQTAATIQYQLKSSLHLSPTNRNERKIQEREGL
jgi:hypothetical protein